MAQLPESVTIPLKITVEVDTSTLVPPPAPIVGVQVVEVSDGVVLKLAPEVRKTLIDFGWLPPVDGE